MAALRPKSANQTSKGTSHSKKELKEIQEIKLEENYSGKEIINRLRGLSTNKIEEGAYFIVNGERYYLQLSILKE